MAHAGWESLMCEILKAQTQTFPMRKKYGRHLKKPTAHLIQSYQMSYNLKGTSMGRGKSTRKRTKNKPIFAERRFT